MYAVCGDEKYRDAAASSADFILIDLHRTEGETGFCFSYTPIDQTTIHNASMLGAALLARLSSVGVGNSLLADEADKAMTYSIDLQREDGSWPHGEALRNRWIDSYHTGYNLMGLHDYQHTLKSDHGKSALAKGYTYYLNTYFTEEGYVKYYHDKPYPYDAHAAAYAVMALSHLSYLDEVRSLEIRARVLDRVLDDFWDERRSCFIYKITAHGKNRINYIRWVQMWMYYALHDYLGTVA